MKKTLTSSFIVLVVGIYFSSCGGMQPSEGNGRNVKSSGTANQTSTNKEKCTTEKGSTLSFSLAGEVTYEGEIKGIINAKCAWCHSATAKPQDRKTPYLTTYEQVKAKYSSSMEEIQSGKMPPKNVTPKLAAGDSATLQAWKDGGFLLGEALPPPDTTAGVFYETAVKPLLKSECTGCHFTGGQSPALDTYDTAKSGAAASLVDIEKGSMPKAGAWDAANKALFKTWVDTGMPFNATGDTPPPEEPSTTDNAQSPSSSTATKDGTSGSATATNCSE